MIVENITSSSIRYCKRRSKQLYRMIFACLLYLFVFSDFVQVYIPIFGYFDELVALLSVPYFILDINHKGLKLKKGNCAIFIVLFTCVGFIGNIVSGTQSITPILLDAFLCVKFWLVIYVGQRISRKFSIKDNASFIYLHIRIITWLFAILTIIAEVGYSPFFGDIRFGFKSVRLFYYHPTTYAATCGLLVAILASIEPQIKRGKFYAVVLLILMCTTLRSKAIGAAISIILIYYFVVIRKKKFRLRTVLLFIPLLIALAWDNIYFYFFSSIQKTSARYHLLTTSLQIAKDYFPVGTGFGTFGSFMSGEYYSSIYSKYGIQSIFGLEKGNATFISDSFWPMIIGQTGVLGFLCFAVALWRLFLRIQNMKKYDTYFYVSALFILAYLMISSVAESAFVHPIAIPMGLWMGCLFENIKKEKIGIYNKVKK